MDINCHTLTHPTTAQLREFGTTDYIRQPFITLDLLQPTNRLSIFIGNDPNGRALAMKIIELLQEAFFTPKVADAAVGEFAA